MVFVCDTHICSSVNAFSHFCMFVELICMLDYCILGNNFLKQKLCGLVLYSSCLYIQDWLDIDFGIAEGVDFIAISFVKSAEVIKHLKSYIAARARDA